MSLTFRTEKITIVVGNRKFGAKGEYVGRPSPLGNPFEINAKIGNTRDVVINKYRQWLKEKIAKRDSVVLSALETLRKRAIEQRTLILVCWCSPDKCHADVIGQILIDAISRGETFA